METQKKRSRTITWVDPMTVPRAAAGRSGLEVLQDIASRKLPPPPITATLGFRGVSFEEGKAVFEGDPDESLYNPIGVVHGGYAMTLLDSAMGCAVQSTLKAGERYTTLEVKTNFVRAITLDTGTVRCVGTIVYRGGTIATAEGRLTNSEGKLLAHATTTCLIVRSA